MAILVKKFTGALVAGNFSSNNGKIVCVISDVTLVKKWSEFEIVAVFFLASVVNTVGKEIINGVAVGFKSDVEVVNGVVDSSKSDVVVADPVVKCSIVKVLK